MAWTSSAGPEGTFVLAEGAAEPNALQGAHVAQRLPATRPLAFATAAHLVGLGIVAPFAANNPLLAIPVLIGLTVSYLTLSHPADPERAKGNEETAAPQDRPSDDTPRPAFVAAANWPADTRHLSARISRLQPAEVNAELRADLMARVSHELRTPLNAVMGFSDLMGHQMFGPLGHPRYEEYVSHIRESSQRLLKSAEDTLAMTSLMAKSSNHCEREPLSLASLFREALTTLSADFARRDVTCITDIGPHIDVIAHRRALRQALVNVLYEALTQIEDGATITISATTDLDRVALLVSADRIKPPSAEEHRSLPICLARTLLELDGSHLHEHNDKAAPWSALLSLEGAMQPDFFAMRDHA